MIVGAGLLLVVGGLLLIGLSRLTGAQGWRLPGDIVVRRGNFTFYFPLATSLLLSLLLTLVLFFLSWAGRR